MSYRRTGFICILTPLCVKPIFLAIVKTGGPKGTLISSFVHIPASVIKGHTVTLIIENYCTSDLSKDIFIQKSELKNWLFVFVITVKRQLFVCMRLKNEKEKKTAVNRIRSQDLYFSKWFVIAFTHCATLAVAKNKSTDWKDQTLVW